MNKYFPLKQLKPAKEEYKFFDNILELVSASTNAVCVAFDAKGEQLSRIFNHNNFSEKLAKIIPMEVFDEICESHHKEAFLECLKTKKPIFSHTLLGFLNYLIPVTIEDKEVIIFIGHVISEKKSGDFFYELAQKIPQVKKLLKDYEGLPRIKESKFREIVKCFIDLTDKEIKRYKEVREKSEDLFSFRKQMQSYFIEIGTAMGSSLNLHKLLNLIVEVSTKLVNAESGSICLIENKDLMTRVSYGGVLKENSGRTIDSLSLRENLIGWDDENKSAYSPESSYLYQQETDSKHIKSYLGIPLLIKEEIKGILNIYDDRTRDFTLEEIEILTAFASQAALAIDNIQLFQFEQTKAKEASNLYNAVRVMGQTLDLNEVINLSTQQVIKIAEVNRVIMFLYDEKNGMFSFAGSAGLSEDQLEFFSMLKITMSDFKEEIWDQIKQGQSVFFDKIPQASNVLQKIYTILPSNSCLIVPLFTKEGLMGLFYLDDSNIAKTFAQSEIKVIMTLAVQIAMAIQRARLLNQLEENFSHLRTLYEISTSLGILKLEKICELVARKSAELSGIKDVSLILFNSEKGIFETASHTGLSDELINGDSVGKILEFVGSRKKPVTANAHAPGRLPVKQMLKKIGKDNLLCVPMYSKNKLLGSLNFFIEGPFVFSDQQIHLVQSFINQAVTSIENALLYKVIQNKVHELATIFEVGKAITSTLHFNRVLEEIASNIMKAVHSNAVSIMLLDEKLEELSVKMARGLGFHHYKRKIKLGEGVAGIAAKTGHPMMLIDKKKRNAEFEFPEDVRKDKLKTILSVPLKAKGRIIGLLNVYSQDIYHYSQLEINLLSTLANQAAMALENAMLYDEQYQIAQIIQSSLMPQEDINFEGIDIGFKYIPSRELSGDYFDLVKLSGKKFALYISDVAGKGTSAAIYTVRGKYILKSFSKIEYEPKDVLNNLNQILCPETEDDKFLSVFYATVDLEKMLIRYSSAGHEPMLMYKSREEAVKTLDSTGLLVGVRDKETYAQCEVSIEKGDILVMYTDGITEARSKRGDFFGLERVKEILTGNISLSAQKIVDKIYNEVQKFTLKRLQDDFTLLVVKF